MKFTSYVDFTHDLASHGAEYAVKRSARLGFESVEFLASYPDARPFYERHDAKKIRALLDEHGLSAACYSIYADLLRGSDEEFFDAMSKHLAFAVTVGSSFFHHTVAPHRPTEGDASIEAVLAKVQARVEGVVAMAKELGILCLYEPQGPYFNGVEGLGMLLRVLAERHDNVAVCGDLGNSLFVDCDPVDICRAFSDRIVHVHVKDYLRSDERQEGAAGQSRAGKWLYDCNVGDGIIDLPKCFSLLKATGYNARFGLERCADDEETVRMMEYVKTHWENA